MLFFATESLPHYHFLEREHHLCLVLIGSTMSMSVPKRAPRQDTYPLPEQDGPFVVEDAVIIITADGANADCNGAADIWPDATHIKTTCFAHVANIWLKKANDRGKFNNNDNIDVLQIDINAYKICPLLHLVEPMVAEWLEKW